MTAKIKRLTIGVEGFEHISDGGLTENRTTLILGTSGSGKTIFTLEVAVRSINDYSRPVVFVSLEESADEIATNIQSFGWDLHKFVEKGKLVLIDASLNLYPGEEAGTFNLKGLLIQIEQAIKKVGGKLVIIDSIGALLSQYKNREIIRKELMRIRRTLKKTGVSTILTSERDADYGLIGKYGFEEYLADNVLIFRNVLEDEKSRRTIQLLKMRGADHQKGEFPFTITDEGIKIVALSAMELKQSSSMDRCSSGNDALDRMTSGGYFRDSIILVSGPTGSGKTLMCTTFVQESCSNDERILYFATEESQQQLIRNAQSWGVDYEKWQKENKLKMICLYPESMGLSEHLLLIKKEIQTFQPKRFIVDSVSALERVASIKTFREFVIGLTSFVKHQEVCSMFTATTPKLAGGDSITEAHISTITDVIILLRYVEISGAMNRGISVIKMRGSQHEKAIRQFEIKRDGLHIGEQFKNIQNIILGIPTTDQNLESEHLEKLFQK